MENYVSEYLFISPALYEEAFGNPPAWDTVYAKTTGDEDVRARLSAELLETPGVKTVGYNDEQIDSYRTMLTSVDSVVVVLIVAAAALAFVVLYNLTNINIAERAREIATLKVLGFTRKEVNAYIFRETMILSVIGTVGMRIIWIYGFFPHNRSLFFLFISYPGSWIATILMQAVCFWFVRKKCIQQLKKTAAV